MDPDVRDLLLVCKDMLEICRYKCGPRDEVILPNGVTNEQVIVAAQRTIERIEEAHTVPEPKPVRKAMWRPGGFGQRESRSNMELIRRNGGIRHQFLDDIGGCSANYR